LSINQQNKYTVKNAFSYNVTWRRTFMEHNIFVTNFLSLVGNTLTLFRPGRGGGHFYLRPKCLLPNFLTINKYLLGTLFEKIIDVIMLNYSTLGVKILLSVK